ncbi:hypothetical protein QUF31_10310 [Dickeya chrysanthemi]|uniref:hypothetical protein n=1 Tax=Dickeya chrysanthemi TaxID=556 RepID=UPI0025A26D0E|nr:hypothetical protein [Dickeya chrysanthemi]WJM87441.1 hypothetical protein QUF31_10310 [Dickeya chrysanthemi]
MRIGATLNQRNHRQMFFYAAAADADQGEEQAHISLFFIAGEQISQEHYSSAKFMEIAYMHT